MESLKNAMQYLLTEGYALKSPQDYYVFTNKFYTEFTDKDIGVVATITAVKTATTIVAIPQEVKEDAYLKFILDANVPKKCEGSNNEVYNTNQYSDKGAKAFIKILRAGVNLDMLIKSTQLYYKTAGFKLKIGNYIGDGAWKTHYQEMVDSAGKNTLKEHITEELKHDTTGTSKYRFGSDRPGETKRIEGSPGQKPWFGNIPKQLK